MRQFWETVTTAVIPLEQGGHVDIFVPLTDTGNYGSGILFVQLTLTSLKSSSPFVVAQPTSDKVRSWNG